MTDKTRSDNRQCSSKKIRLYGERRYLGNETGNKIRGRPGRGRSGSRNAGFRGRNPARLAQIPHNLQSYNASRSIMIYLISKSLHMSGILFHPATASPSTRIIAGLRASRHIGSLVH
ncbi:hypothetical protein PAXRUDRAFT_484231 [Paxillus rubicundulus Ve08.2h10]|uniref:Uncharacterized protein n=1 Tax=Paxillus rubicundulus Ve08.2h10 TaxID=930991 RepID=A0A0D0E189_9AGAM|nr:hypothetical protein PAXRUDRAFT_484231 [Paxillus rubicundulus Ve08.2h10]